MSLCNWLINLVNSFHYWYKPEEFKPSKCVMEMLKRIYPTVD